MLSQSGCVKRKGHRRPIRRGPTAYRSGPRVILKLEAPSLPVSRYLLNTSDIEYARTFPPRLGRDADRNRALFLLAMYLCTVHGPKSTLCECRKLRRHTGVLLQYDLKDRSTMMLHAQSRWDTPPKASQTHRVVRNPTLSSAKPL